MAESKLKPYADLKYKARSYKDESGKDRNVWVKVGTLFSTPHGSNMTIKLDNVPVGDWNGFLAVFKRDDVGQTSDGSEPGGGINF